MKTFVFSEDYKKDLQKQRMWLTAIFALIFWSLGAFLWVLFTKVNMWHVLAVRYPVIAGFFFLFFIFNFASPVLIFLYYTAIIKRAGVTRVELLDDRLIKNIGGEEEIVLFSELSEILAVRFGEGMLVSIRLTAQKGASMALHHLKQIDEFFLALKSAAPSCSTKEVVVPKQYMKILYGSIALTGLLVALGITRVVDVNTDIGLMCVVLLGFWVLFWPIHKKTFRYNNQQCLFSSHLGPRFQWLDYTFAIYILGLFALGIIEGVRAIHAGKFTNLLGILFPSTIMVLIFVIPLIRKVYRETVHKITTK